MKHRKHHITNKIHKLKPKYNILKSPGFWFFLLFCALIISTLYVILFHPKFQVKLIALSGNTSVESKIIEDVAWSNINRKIFNLRGWNLSTKSIFLSNPNIISKEILDKLPQIESAQVYKTFPQSIVISIKERKSFAAYCNSDDESCFCIDKNGVIFNPLVGVDEGTTIIKQSTNSQNIVLGETPIAKEIINFISKIKDNLRDNFQIEVKEALITSPLRLNIKTNENWQIYFNLESDMDAQVTKMILLLKDEISKESRENLQYIDLRFKDRAYYK